MTATRQEPAGTGLSHLENGIARVTGAAAFDWKRRPTDSGLGWAGLSYMRETSKIRRDWERRWPETVPQPQWTRIARIQTGPAGCWEWVLVAELHNPRDLERVSLPTDAAVLERIVDIVDEAKSIARVSEEADWLSLGFDIVSRVALRAYLSSRGSCGRMAFVCTGRGDWEAAITEVKDRLALRPGSAVAKRISWIQV